MFVSLSTNYILYYEKRRQWESHFELIIHIFYFQQPTITPFPGFSVANDATALREAMKGLGTDEDIIIDILTSRCNSQRQQIAKFFKDELGRVSVKLFCK